MRIYLDNGSTTILAPEVKESMSPYLDEDYGNASSLHQWGRDARDAIESARKKIADQINADPTEIIFTSGGTESNNLTLKGLSYSYPDKKHIIISAIEHDCILNASKWLKQQGYDLTVLPVDSTGIVDPQVLSEAIRDDTLVVSIMHANNEIGTILPIDEYGKICRENGTFFHTDACQSFTKVPIDVKEMNIDLMTLNAHKIHGPKGVGALYLRKGVKITPLSHGGGHEFKKRSGTENVPGIVGFATASTLLTEEDKTRMTELRDYLIEELLKIPETQLNGHKTKRLCNNANIGFHFIEGESLLMFLDMKGIAVSTGSACSSSSLEPSHVLIAIGLRHEVAHGAIRFTLSKYTTKDEIDFTIDSVKDAVEKLRKISPLKTYDDYKIVYSEDDHEQGHEH